MIKMSEALQIKILLNSNLLKVKPKSETGVFLGIIHTAAFPG
jgi:hypothetical protein